MRNKEGANAISRLDATGGMFSACERGQKMEEWLTRHMHVGYHME